MIRDIKTELGIIKGRDAIYLDRVIQTFHPSSFRLEGEVNGNLCSVTGFKGKWVKYKMEFVNCKFADCHHIDLVEKNDENSNFTQTTPSQISSMLKPLDGNYSCFTVITYDYLYKFIATGYTLELLSIRAM